MRVGVSLITHATEDGPRLRARLGAALGIAEFDTSIAHGHHDNPIEISTASAGTSAVSAIANAAGSAALEGAVRERLSGGKLHLRLDKQEIAAGRLALSESDPVKVTVTVPGGLAGDYRRVLGLD